MRTKAITICLLISVLAGCAKVYDNPPVITCKTQFIALKSAILRADSVGGKITIIAPTNSMSPLITGQNYGVLVKIPYAELGVGDIVTYQPKWHPSGPVIHRLVLKDQWGWIAEGDAKNNKPENWERVTEENYGAKLIEVFSWKNNE